MMKNVISFLEKLGQNADLKLENIDFETLLENEDFDPEVKEAILAEDQNAIEMILNARSKIVCLLVPAEEDEEDTNSDDDKESEEKSALRNAV